MDLILNTMHGSNNKLIKKDNKIQFCHISPVNILNKVSVFNDSHLILAHLVESNKDYRDFYKNVKVDANAEKIMDNSAFEMFKNGQQMYDSKQLVELGKLCNATTLVLSDYPKEDWKKTKESAEVLIPIFKQNGFKTFYVPQSELGDLNGYIKSVMWALKNPNIDYIGLSILGCPIALGLEEKQYNTKYDEAYKMQRFLARWKILQYIENAANSHFIGHTMVKRFHCLGLVDGPEEIKLLENYHNYIKSWDSSSAVWAGLNNIRYDNSPTGLRMGKFENEVDFDSDLNYNNLIEWNVKYISGLL